MLALLCTFFLAVEHQHLFDVGLIDLEIPHLDLRGNVAGIGGFLFGKKLSVLRGQDLLCRQLFHTLVVKGFLRCLVDNDISLMLGKELFRVPRLAVLRVNLTGFGMQIISESRRIASVLPQKFLNFRAQSSDVEFQII